MTSRAEEKGPAGTQALGRALALLEQLTVGREHSLSALADAVGLPRPTAHRLLAALAASGLVERGSGQSYRIGRGAVELGYRAQRLQPGSQPRGTPFGAAQAVLNESGQWRDWSGYLLPTHYGASHEREYYAIRSSVGIIDVSPLFKYDFVGPGAIDLAQRVFTRDFATCRVGQVRYTCWCDDRGKLIQDGNVVRLAEDHLRVTAAEPSLRWFEDCAVGLEVDVRDCSSELAALAIQGPNSAALLSACLDGIDLGRLRYFRGAGARFAEHEIYLTRTGFTGDLGYELWIERAIARELWDALLAEGRSFGARPVGLAALDLARIEAGLVLIDVDYVSALAAKTPSLESSPFEAGLGFTVSFAAGNDFVGRSALEDEKSREPSWLLRGLEVGFATLDGIFRARGLRPTVVGEPPCRERQPVMLDGVQVGQVTSQVFSPLLRSHLAIVTLEASKIGTAQAVELELMIDSERVPVPAQLCALPFFDPERKRVLPSLETSGTPK